MSDTVDQDPVCSKSDLFVFFTAILLNLAFCTLSLLIFLVSKITTYLNTQNACSYANTTFLNTTNNEGKQCQ